MGSWESLDEPTHSLTIEYSFRPGSTARSFVTRFHADELVVLSPPVGVDASVFEELEQHGRVTALVAPNGFHYMGLEPALSVFPEATLFAPEAAGKRLQKKLAGRVLHPLAELQTRSEAPVQILEVPGFSIGETWVIVNRPEGPLWYVSDSCFNMSAFPDSLPVKLLFKWTKSAPGLCINGVGNLFFLKDKAAYRRWFEQQLAEPPRTLVPAHGSVASGPDLAASLQKLVEARL